MNLEIVLPALVVLLGLRLFKPRMIVWLIAWWVANWVIIDFGFAVPVPQTVVKLYMGIITLALAAYVTADPERFEEVKRPTLALLVERRLMPLLALVVIAIPAAVAASIYFDMTAPPRAPVFGRTVHPAPPTEITVHDQPFDLTTLDNPLRLTEANDPDEFGRRVADGRRVYYENCFYCHGDLMRGQGIFAHGLNPIPTNFQDPGTIAMLQEGFLFWRVSRGGPGMPEEGGPWMSAMPAWEKFLTVDEMWSVIAFLYDFTEQRPRALHAKAGSGEGEH